MAERSTGASGPRAQEPLRLGCIFEQAIGHITFRANLEAQMRAWPDVAPEWHLLPYESAGRWPPRRLNWTLRSGLMARSALRGRSYDVLLFHTHLPALLCLDHLRRMPTLLSMDATPAQNARLGIYVGGAQRRALMRHLAGDWTVRALRRAHRIIAWSRWVQQSLITEYGVDPARVDVLAPGVNVALWEGRFRAGRELGGRGKAGRPARVLFVGGDLRAKGGEILLEAFRRSWRGRAELHLVTRTPVPRELGVYTYAGLTPNSPGLVRLFGAADLFVLPTLGDTFAQVVLEAMASGLPVVASRVGAIPELVVDGETGFLVPPGDADALAQAVNTLLEESRLRERDGPGGMAARSRGVRYRAQRAPPGRTGTARAGGSAMRRVMLPGWRVPILMYHRVTDAEPGPADYFFSISRRRFAQQMHSLRRLRFHIVSLDQIVDWLRRGRALPPRPVAITFDDGYADTYRLAVPILQALRFPATFFLVSDHVGGSSRWEAESGCADQPLIGWEEARALARQGFTIGSHTRSHAVLTVLSDECLRAELLESRAIIERQLKTLIRFSPTRATAPMPAARQRCAPPDMRARERRWPGYHPWCLIGGCVACVARRLPGQSVARFYAFRRVRIRVTGSLQHLKEAAASTDCAADNARLAGGEGNHG